MAVKKQVDNRSTTETQDENMETFVSNYMDETSEETSIPDYMEEKTEVFQENLGLSEEEFNEPNGIQVTISNPNIPIVVLFGYPACGKTMTLVRLTRFLTQEGYRVEPVRDFRPALDTNYKEMCDKFGDMISSFKAAESTNRISFMLVEIFGQGGRPICQILEAPGEGYFNLDRPNEPFPSYVNSIISSKNHKIWMIMVEPNWKDHTDRMKYVARINQLKRNMHIRDKVVFVYNKIDKTPFVVGIDQVNVSQAIKETKYQYPGVFECFRNQNPITRLWQEYTCGFVPFQTGFYTASIKGKTYQDGPPEYCAKLWNAILKQIRG